MDGFKGAVSKLEQLRDGGFITPEEFEKRKKELVDSYVMTAAGSASGGYSGAPAAGESNIVKLRGLPFTATEADVANFLRGFQLDSVEPIKFQLTAEGKHSGICFVRLASEEEAARALTKNRQYLGQRYVEVFPSSYDELAQKTAPPGSTSWVRMRGLPFSATKGDIKAFFEGFNISDAGIFMVTGKGGRPSGEAFVQFGDEFESQRALLKDKEPMGMRYIELFLATREECDSAIARYRGESFGKGGFGGGYGGAAYPAPAYGGGFGGGFGGRGGKGFGRGGDFVVRLRGLPFRATEHDVNAFFAGLHVLRSSLLYADGRPSGEGFVEFRDKYSWDGALARNRQLMGSRYIEVFPSSRAELEAVGFEDPYAYGGY